MAGALVVLAAGFNAEPARAGEAKPTAQVSSQSASIVPQLSAAKVVAKAAPQPGATSTKVKAAPTKALTAKPVKSTTTTASKPAAVSSVSAKLKVPPDLLSAHSVKVPLKVQNLAAKELKTSGPKVETDEQGDKFVTLGPDDEVAVAPTGDLPAVELNVAQRQNLPGALLRTEPSGTEILVQTARLSLELIEAVSWDGSHYRARLRVEIDPPPGELLIEDLKTALEVNFSAAKAKVDPETITLKSFGPSGKQEVNVLVAPAEAAAKQQIKMHSLLGLQSFEFSVQRKLAALSLQSSLTEVTGLGIGTAPLTIRLLSEDGGDVVTASPVQVHLTTTQGSVDPALVEITPGKSVALAEYHTARLGTAELFAKLGGLESEHMRLNLTFPWLELIAALIGGSLGAVLRRFRQAGIRRGLGSLAVEGIVSAVVAFGVVLAVPIEVGMSEWVRYTVLGAFVIGAAAGLFGASLLGVLLRRVVPAVSRRSQAMPATGAPSAQQRTL